MSSSTAEIQAMVRTEENYEDDYEKKRIELEFAKKQFGTNYYILHHYE